jgi:hypothetical protein
MGHLHNGIFYKREQSLGNSFCVLFLRASENANATDIGNILENLWLRLKELEKGIIKDLDLNPKKKTNLRKSLNTFRLWP